MAGFKEQKKIPLLHIFDFETGGLDASKCGATQLTVQLVRADDWSVIGVYNEYIKPYSKRVVKKETKKRLKSKFEEDEQVTIIPMEYNEKALSITGITLEKLESDGIEIEEAAEKYLQFLSDNKVDGGSSYLLCGQNVTFDIDFLFAFIEYAVDGKKKLKKLLQTVDMRCLGDDKMWLPKYLDTLPLGKTALHNDLDSFSLEVLCANVGMEVETAHNALYDVEATGNLLRTYLERIKNNSSGETFQVAEKEKDRKHFTI
ncbi:MAG: 3'-5' exonuclease [Bacteroidales bacterium]